MLSDSNQDSDHVRGERKLQRMLATFDFLNVIKSPIRITKITSSNLNWDASSLEHQILVCLTII